MSEIALFITTVAEASEIFSRNVRVDVSGSNFDFINDGLHLLITS